jgi:SAM-dependent methyltransferase
MRVDVNAAMHRQMEIFSSDTGWQAETPACTIISVNDDMFHGDPDSYFRVGLEAAILVSQLVSSPRMESTDASILVFPCGHGRETRFLKALYPRARIFAGDLDEDGINFCSTVLGCLPIQSNEDFSLVELPMNCDVIWVGSLVTHLSEGRTKELIELLLKSLAKGASLIFSSHGEYVADKLRNGPNYGIDEEGTMTLLRDFEARGYGYCDYSKNSNYGISIISENWFFDLASELKIDCNLEFFPTHWDNHHDIISFTII